ncbi:LysR substrate-binding domain-containing protein [Massilia sp. H-1]|nr:LysR substrate-binding domain-containing protein [Massilia sp. H-1]
MLCASPYYLARCGVPDTPDALLAHQCLHFSHLTDGTSWHFSRNGQERTVRVNAGFTSNNGLVLHQAALRGLGIILQHHLPRVARSAGRDAGARAARVGAAAQ